MERTEIKIGRDSAFQPAEGITWRDIKGELIALELESGEYFSFSEIGRLAWLALAEGRSVGQVVEAVPAEYEVSLAQAESDVVAFTQGLLENRLIVPRTQGASS